MTDIKRRDVLLGSVGLGIAAALPSLASAQPRDWTKDKLHRMTGVGQHFAVNTGDGTYRSYRPGDDLTAIYRIDPIECPLKAKQP